MLFKNKNSLLLLLMGTSMLLLLALEGLWLRQSYNKQAAQLEETIDRLFVESVFDQQDSLINRLILRPIMDQLPDSVQGIDLYPGFNNWRRKREQDKKEHPYYPRRDSFSLPRSQDTMDKVQFMVVKPDGKERSMEVERRIIRSLAFTLKGLDREEFSFISFGDDSLRLADIKADFQQKLSDAEIAISFTIFRKERDSILQIDRGFLTKSVRGDIPFRTTYQAHITQASPYLLRKQVPLFLFSMMLTLLTAAAFYLAYASLKREQRLTTMKNQFISNVTHELQTPITSVGVALEAISRFDVIKDKERTKEYLEISKAELNRLSLLVDKVLKMALFEEKALQLHPEQLDLEQLVKQTLHTLHLQFEQVGAEVSFETEGQNFEICGDRIHMTSVLYNLIDNSLKYNEAPIRVHLSVKEEAERIILRVKDNGIGIPDDYQRKIFDKFFRVPSGDLHKVKGHGLGLSYVATILEAAGADLHLESEKGIGTEFTLIFAKAKPNDVAKT